MKTFLLILLFANELLLTPNPLTFNGNILIALQEPIHAITSGASLEIDVTSMISIHNRSALFEYWSNREYLNEFSPNSITAYLEDRNGHVIILKYDGQAIISDKRLWLILDNNKKMQTGINFVSVRVQSNILLKDVKIYWKNYSQ